MKTINFHGTWWGVSGFLTVFAVLGLLVPARLARAEQATLAEVREVAQGWVAKLQRLQRGGEAGPNSEIGNIQELKDGPRLVAYYCAIKSGGYVVVSLHKELPPIHAYSLTGSLDPGAAVGMMGLIKRGAAGRIQKLEERLGPLDQARPDQFRAVMSRDYTADWTLLRTAASTGGQTAPGRGVKWSEEGYRGGRVLLSSAWSQHGPYNQYCPTFVNCGHAPVGCVFLAAAQLMRYWGWPPRGAGAPYDEEAYDWVHMPDILTDGSSEEEKHAVARLCYHAGRASGADYGCEDTLGLLWWDGLSSMDDGYEDTFRYSVDSHTTPPGYGPMKDELNANQPIHYAVAPDFDAVGHSFVVDGWREHMAPVTQELHVNEGYGRGGLAWINMDDGMPGSSSILPDTRLDNVVPECLQNPYLWGTYEGGVYPMLARHRYYSLGAVGAARFAPGQSLHFLPTTTMKSTAEIKIEGTEIHPTRLFAGGDSSKGILIRNGSLKLGQFGQLSLCPLVPPRYVDAEGRASQPYIEVVWERGLGNDTEVLIERSQGSPDNWVQIASVSSTCRLYHDYDIEPDVEYYYRLRCAGAGRLSEWSNVDSDSR
jgi:hypothetical protein